jgi:hypothetical protein
MHVIIAILVIFMAPVDGKPEQVLIAHFPAATAEACPVEGALAENVIAQRPGVSSVVFAGCIQATNLNDKAA